MATDINNTNNTDNMGTLIESLLQASSHLSYRRALWKAEREGRSQDLSMLEGVPASDPKAIWNALQQVKEEKRRQDVAEREYNASVRALQRSMWKAERLGDEESLRELREAIGTDPKNVWNTLQNVKENQKRREAIFSPSFTGMRKLKLEASRFTNVQDRISYVKSFGYTPEETAQIVQGTDELRNLTRKRAADAERADLIERAEVANFASIARDLSEETEGFDREESLRKLRYLHKIGRGGQLTSRQLTSLEQLSGSYDDLVDATDDLIKKNQQLLQVYEAIGNIKMYDPNQFLASARGQASGILGAAKGIVPSFILNPLSRLTDATFNYQQGKLTGFNAVSRTWNSGIGQAITGILGATMGPMGLGIGSALTGGVNAVSQVAGNIGQYRMEKAGFAIQNNLNTLGAIFSWVSAPFQLLNKATKALIGSFSGLSVSLSRLMAGGLGDMSNMGNPLTELTGVNYAAYQGTTMMDAASLFNRGTMNSVYENFANQQRAFYTTGEVNTGRLIASSLLGVYKDVYGPDTNVDTETRYNTMVNDLLKRMQGKSKDEQARMMYLASQIDSNLPGLLHTANLLGVTDISTLTDPNRRGVYFRGINDKEAARFRWDQYEFGAARTQLGNTKMRFADRLWNSIGKDLYNGFNRLTDSALTGDWNAAVSEASDMWEKFKTKFVTVWDGIKGVISGDGEGLNWGEKLVGVFAKVGIAALEVVRMISNAWGQLVGIVLDKAQGLISYLSTISLKPHIGADGRISFEVQSIKDRMEVSDKDRIASSDIWVQDPKKGWVHNWESKGSYAELARQLFPDMSESQLASLTVGDLRKKLLNMQDTWTDPEGNAGRVLTLNGSEFVPDSPEAIATLLGLAQLAPGREFNAAAFASGMVPGFRKRDIVYTGESLGDSVRDFHSQATAEVLNPLIDAAQESLGAAAQKLELNIKINDKDAAKVEVADGKAVVHNVRTMLNDIVNRHLSFQVSQQR